MIEKLKVLAGVSEEDTSQDVFLQFALDEASETILNYCNLEEVPDGLQSTLVRMALEYYRNQNLGSVDETQGTVRTISEGDTSISFSGSGEFGKGPLSDYKGQLNRYRVVNWK